MESANLLCPLPIGVAGYHCAHVEYYSRPSNVNQVTPSLSMITNRMSDGEFVENGNSQMGDERIERSGRLRECRDFSDE